MASVSAVGSAGNVLIDSLVGGERWDSGSAKTVIKVGYSTTGGLQPTRQELRAMSSIFSSFEAVIKVDLQFIGNAAGRDADIVFKFQNKPNSPYYGTADSPNADQPSVVTIQRSNYKDGLESKLTSGSFDYYVLLHEFSHAMGLAHPHQDSDVANKLTFPGLGASYRELGSYELNQTAFTAMSYNFGWKTAPAHHTPSERSNAAGPMALDIAALQFIYGANATAAKGTNIYRLADQVSHKALSSIWDTGGVDTISALGLGASRIDLRAATIALDKGGGGYMSYAIDQPGGLTIARGVVIENAMGGNFDDVLIGNTARNVLTGNNGRDVMYGRGGRDVFDFNRSTDSNGAAVDVIRDFSDGDRVDLSTMDASWVRSFRQDFSFKGNAARFTDDGQLRFVYSGEDTLVLLNFDNDLSAESVIRLSGRHELDRFDFIL